MCQSGRTHSVARSCAPARGGGICGPPFHRRPQGDRHGRPVRSSHARRACARHRGPHGRPRANRRGSRAPPGRSHRHHRGMDAQADGRRVLAQSGTLLVHGRRANGPAVVALYDLVTGEQRWVNEGLFEQTEPRKKGLGGLMQGLVRAASEATALEVLQAGPDMIVVHTLMGLRALDARSGAVRWSATLPTARAGNPARHVRLYPSLDKTDRIYMSFDDRLMAYRLADGQALWAKPATVDGWVHGIVQHPNGIIMLPESPPANEATGNVRIVNGVVQTGLNVARYDDGTTIAAKPLRMRGTVTDAMIVGGSAVLAVDAESRTFVNVLDVATATLRLKKDVKIKGQLAYAELTPAGLLYISRPDPATNAEVNIINLTSGQPKFKDAIESGRPWGGNDRDYDAARYYLHHVVEGRTLYVFASHDHRLYAVDRDAGTFRPLGGEIKLQGGEDPTAMEIRSAGIVLISPQNLVVVTRDGQVKQQDAGDRKSTRLNSSHGYISYAVFC